MDFEEIPSDIISSIIWLFSCFILRWRDEDSLETRRNSDDMIRNYEIYFSFKVFILNYLVLLM